MNKGIYLAIGVLVGGAAGWFGSKLYYDKKAQKHVISGTDILKEAKKEEPQEEKKEPEVVIKTPEQIKELYSEVLGKKNYGDPTSQEDYSRRHIESATVVTANEWAQPNGFNKVELVYYAGDDVLATYDNDIYDDYDAVGNKYVGYLKDTDADVVYVRNEALQIDFEISFDGRSYDDVVIEE